MYSLLKLHGTRSLEDAIAPALALLDAGGRDWHPRLAVTLRKLVEAERKKVGTREEKLTAARDRFYLGDVADELELWYVSRGAFLRKQDLAAQRVTVEEPVAVNYRGYTVYKCGSWPQGPALCEALRLLEGFDLRGMRHFSADYVHAVTESLKLSPGKGITMSELRNRMNQDMQLAGLVEGTRQQYLRAVRQLTAYYMVSPDRLSERKANSTSSTSATSLAWPREPSSRSLPG